MSLTGILLGVLDILILVVILMLIGAIIMWVLTALGWPPPQQVQRLYMAVVALIALVALISLLLGVPRVHIVAANQAAVVEDCI
jgi:hypothetical protein